MPQKLIDHALIICTKNRASALDKQREYLEMQTHIPEFLYLVDASDIFNDDEHRRRYQHIPVHLTIFHSQPHLPFQRNLAIQHLPDSIRIVHFLDDDSFPEANYFDEINRAFFENESFWGIGGLIKQANIHKPFFLDPPIPGTLASNGRTLDAQVFPYSLNRIFESRYLSGCSMSFRREAFDITTFDENLKGYAQDEDLAFCLSLKKKLGVTPFTAIWHFKVADARLNSCRFKEQAIINRYYVMKTYATAEFSEYRFTLNLFVQCLILIRKPLQNQELIIGWIRAVKKWIRYRKNPSLTAILSE